MSYSAFDPMEFAQANPFATLETFPQFFNQLSQNQIAAAQAQYAPQQLAAGIANTQAQTANIYQGQLPNEQANAANTAAQTALLQGLTPAQIQSAQSQANIAQLGAQQALKYPGAAAPGIIGTVNAAGYLSNPPTPTQTTVAPQQLAGAAGANNPLQVSTVPSPNAINTGASLPTLPQTPAQQNSLMSTLGQMGHPQTLTQAVLQSQFAPLYKTAAQANLAQQQAQNFPWSTLPTDQKDQYLAQLGGMGIPPQQAIGDYNQGKSLGQIASENGFDPNQLPDPVYPTSKAMQTTIQRRNQADAELNSLNQFVIKAVSPYAQTINGYSPAQVSQALKIQGGNGTPQDVNEQAQYYAAKALSPEIAGIRMRIMNGQVGIGAIQELQDASNSNLKSFGPLMTPEVYAKTQTIIQQQLQQALSAANTQTKSPPTSVAAAQAQQQQTSGTNASQKVQMPSFNSKADFQNWYGNLSSAQQAQVRQQLGGQ